MESKENVQRLIEQALKSHSLKTTIQPERNVFIEKSSEIELIWERFQDFAISLGLDNFKKISLFDVIKPAPIVDFIGRYEDEGQAYLIVIDHILGINQINREHFLQRYIQTLLNIYLVYGFVKVKVVYIVSPSNDNKHFLEYSSLNAYYQIQQVVSDISTVIFPFNCAFINWQQFLEIIKICWNNVGSLVATIELFIMAKKLFNSSKFKKDNSTKIIKRRKEKQRAIKRTSFIIQHFRCMLEIEQIGREDILRLQDKEYCKNCFRVHYPVLAVYRQSWYYKEPVSIGDETYWIFQKWNTNSLKSLEDWINKRL